MRVAAPLDLATELRKIPLFAELPRHHFADVLARTHATRVESDKAIVVEGEPSPGVPVLLQGLVKMTMGRVVVDVLRGPTAPFLSGTLEQTPSALSVIAMRSCDIALIDRSVLLAALTATPTPAARLADHLAREARANLRRIPELVGGSVEDRLITLLDRLSERHGSPLDDGRYMALPLRRCDLAMMVHATTETVSRTLAEWERRGWLRSNRAGLWWGSRKLREGTTPSVVPARPKSERPEM